MSDAQSRTETLAEFFDRVDRETWQGFVSAFRNGAKKRLQGDDTCNYARADFKAAWRRGWDAMDDNLGAGNSVIAPEQVPAGRQRRRHVYGAT